jgi:transcriptional regulator with XRE-family HTH domain
MGITLKSYRISKNMSKTELASKAHVSRTHISEIEKNSSFPSEAVLKRIAIALNTCPYYLLDFCTNCTLENCTK